MRVAQADGRLLTSNSQERDGQDDQAEGNPVVGKRLEGVGLDVTQKGADDDQGYEKRDDRANQQDEQIAALQQVKARRQVKEGCQMCIRDRA